MLGRFASEDPGRDGWNWFGYAGGSPTTQVDRSGKRPDPPQMISIVALWSVGATLAIGSLDEIERGNWVGALNMCAWAVAAFAFGMGVIAPWWLSSISAMGALLLTGVGDFLGVISSALVGAKAGDYTVARSAVRLTYVYSLTCTAALWSMLWD